MCVWYPTSSISALRKRRVIKVNAISFLVNLSSINTATSYLYQKYNSNVKINILSCIVCEVHYVLIAFKKNWEEMSDIALLDKFIPHPASKWLDFPLNICNYNFPTFTVPLYFPMYPFSPVNNVITVIK